MKTRQMSDRQMTGKNNGAAVSGVNGRVVDFRKDPAPTNWLVKQALEDAKDDGYPVENFKAPSDYLKEFIGELSELRCEPVCANGQLADGCNRPAVGCICSLVEQLTNPDVDLVVPKDAFLAIVGAAGYGTEEALEQYRNYFSEKLWDKNGAEILQLDEECENAYNWWKELDSGEAYAQLLAAGNELDALRHKIDQEVEAVMSA